MFYKVNPISLSERSTFSWHMLFFFGEGEGAEAGGGGGGFADADQLVAEVHGFVVAVGVLGGVDLEEAVEVAQEVGTAHVEDDLVADFVGGVHLEGATVVGGVDNHDALHVVAGGHIGDVELLAFGAFVAHKGAERLHDVVCVASQLLGDIAGLGMGKGGQEAKEKD